jgi:hypothetical protein
MSIAELPEALAALARDLERRDDDPFTLCCHAAVLLAKRTIEDERRWLEQAVGHPGPPASEQEDYNPAADLSTYRDALIERLDNELRFHQELMEIRRALLGPDHYKIARSTTEALAELLRVTDKPRLIVALEDAYDPEVGGIDLAKGG